MSFKQTHRGIAAAAVRAAGVPPAAHHAFASELDAKRRVEVVGVVKEMRFSNPHPWIYITVKSDSGELQHRASEGTAPNALQRRGLTRGSLATGTEIRI